MGFRPLTGPTDWGLLPLVGQTLGAAFATDPLMRWVLPDDRKRKAQLTWMFERCARYALPLGGVYALADGDAAAVVLPPGAFGADRPLGLLRSGLVGVPWQIGLGAFIRLERHEQACIRYLRQQGLAAQPYVWLIGVAPHRQGQGLGGALLRGVAAHYQERGTPICLKTENPANRGFYRAMGGRELPELRPATGIPVWGFSWV